MHNDRGHETAIGRINFRVSSGGGSWALSATITVERFIASAPTVPPKYSNRSVIIEVDQLSPVRMVGSATAAHCARRSVLVLQDCCGSTAGKPRIEAAARRLASVGAAAVETDACRSNLLGVVAACLG